METQSRSVSQGEEKKKDTAARMWFFARCESDAGFVAHRMVSSFLFFLFFLQYIQMAASSNFGNCFSLLIAAARLPLLPAGALQLLTQGGVLSDISQ